MLNALDADASDVRIHLATHAVAVLDNGCGVLPHDAPLLGERGATSGGAWQSQAAMPERSAGVEAGSGGELGMVCGRPYGRRGAFLHALAQVAALEVVSRAAASEGQAAPLVRKVLSTVPAAGGAAQRSRARVQRRRRRHDV